LLRILAGIAVALVVSWAALIAGLVLARPKGSLLQEAIRIVPHTLRLLHRLADDRDLPRSVRLRLWFLLAYLALPFDLVPDFIPMVGYADDAIITIVVLRSVVRRAGGEAVRRHWPGTPDGLAALWRVARLPSSP